MRVVSIGECMVEINSAGGGLFSRAFGGDTLNTAIYLARLGTDVAYATALGDDHLSAEMLAGWQAEGIDTGLVLRVPGRLPGLYMIERDAKGERSFLYWRDRAPARELFTLADADYSARLGAFDWIYFSGISLSLYGDEGRARLKAMLAAARRRGAKVAFDGNYRPRGWSDPAAARAAFTAILEHVDLALPTLDDETMLFGDADAAACAARIRAAGVGEVVVKEGAKGCTVFGSGAPVAVAPPRAVQPVDTTAAGDSFNAGYLAARIRGADAAAAALAGHRLAGTVIAWPGAIIPREAMPD
ncbi:sugar kinase [Pseudoxanthobacter sp.]|uniref:sugar kinase n=1 Tax=Pseudoxanthobacter sp. TaxID=1925742 RepID=UPI002FE3E9D1